MPPISWANIAAAPPPTPTPAQLMHELRAFYTKQPKRSILLSALGFHATLGASANVAALMEHAVVVGIDTEAWTKNTDEMTEIGLAVFERGDMVGVQSKKGTWEKKKKDGNEKKKNKTGENGNRKVKSGAGGSYEHLGPFASSLLHQITFHHLRIVETAHLKTNADWMKGADGNRFGHSRFVTFAEARAILDALFSQPIPPTSLITNPDLKGCKRPIILVGHAMYHDEAHFRKNGLSYDLFQHGTVVKQIDTQPLAKATHTWLDPAAPSNDVGLERLTRTLGFEHEDAHTACNDAARTLISAIQMVLPRQCRENNDTDMQTVAWDIEKRSRETVPPTWGSEKCCTRCGARDHSDTDGERCTVPVHCKACAQFDGKGGQGQCTTHVEMYCLHVAEYKGWARRRDDAIRKRNPIPPGPPEGSHPPSNAAAPSYAGTERSDASLTRSAGSSDSEASGQSDGSSSSSMASSGGIGGGASSSEDIGHVPPARIVSFQSSGRGRGGGRGIRGVGGTRGGSVLSRDWRRADDWRPITKW